MARACEYCGRKTQIGSQVTYRGKPKYQGGVGVKITGRSRRAFKPNVQKVRAIVGGGVARVSICTRCIKAGKIKKPA